MIIWPDFFVYLFTTFSLDKIANLQKSCKCKHSHIPFLQIHQSVCVLPRFPHHYLSIDTHFHIGLILKPLRVMKILVPSGPK